MTQDNAKSLFVLRANDNRREYETCLPGGDEVVVHRYFPQEQRHVVNAILYLYQGDKAVCSLDMEYVDPEARLLVWIMAAQWIFSEPVAQLSSELWDRVPVDFPHRMKTLSPGYEGLHGPFGRGLDQIRKNPPAWFRCKKVGGKMRHWLALPLPEGVVHSVDAPLLLYPVPQETKLSRAFIVEYLRTLADKIENDNRNVDASMPVREEHQPLRPWYVAGKLEPQGYEYAGDHKISLQIVLPRRVGERVPTPK